MQLEIDDALSGGERKNLLRFMPIDYALKFFEGNRTQSAKWLGVSVRTLRNIINEIPELHKHKIKENRAYVEHKTKKNSLSELTLSQRCVFEELLEIMKSKPGWRFAGQPRRNFLYKDLIEQCLKNKAGA